MDIPLIDQIQRWFEQSPKAQRAVKRLSVDLDTLVERLEGAIPPGVRDAIAARIDPPTNAPTPLPDTTPPLPEAPTPEPPRSPS